jgi:hypothetical protein
MKKNQVKTAALALVALLITGGLPLLAGGSSSSNIMSAEAQTRRTRRPAVTTLVPAGTGLRVRLNNDLSSDTSRVGDRFTATVVNPSRYEEATVTGHISAIRKSGRVEGRTSMNLAFDSIQMSGAARCAANWSASTTPAQSRRAKSMKRAALNQAAGASKRSSVAASAQPQAR